MYLQSPVFKLPEVFAYFRSFVQLYIPNTLHSKYSSSHGCWLPHLQCVLTLCDLLLKYHDSELYRHITEKEVTFQTFGTSWLMTLFTRVVDFALVYELFEILLFEGDELFPLFLPIALLVRNREAVLRCLDLETLIVQLQRNIKVSTAKELADLYFEAVRVRSNTPVSVAILV